VRIPRTAGYRDLEAGPLTVDEARAAQDTTLTAAAAAIARPPPVDRPLFSMGSEESVASSMADSDGQFGATNFFDWGPTEYESLEMSVFKHSSYPAGPALLKIEPPVMAKGSDC